MGFSGTDTQWMRQALDLAAEAAERGEVPVGAVLVRDEQLLGSGSNAPIALQDPSGHAELLALRAAATSECNYRLPGTTLYVTLEPCMMCAGAIVHARVQRLVFGAFDPKSGMAGSVANLFAEVPHNHQVQIHGGLLEAECGDQLRQFFRARRK